MRLRNIPHVFVGTYITYTHALKLVYIYIHVGAYGTRMNNTAIQKRIESLVPYGKRYIGIHIYTYVRRWMTSIRANGTNQTDWPTGIYISAGELAAWGPSCTNVERELERMRGRYRWRQCNRANPPPPLALMHLDDDVGIISMKSKCLLSVLSLIHVFHLYYFTS